MRITTWGCRGSLASPGATRVHYGGDTSCVEIRIDDDALLILDAGTGIRELGATGAFSQVHILLTHLHMDHIEGFPFFASLWDPNCEVHVWGPPSPMLTLKQRVARYMSPPLFPIDVHDVPCRASFHDLPTEPWTIAGATVTAMHVEHPGPTVGFRIEEGGASFAYIPDHEPAVLGDFRNESPEWIDGYALADGVDVLMHDAQYTPEEYETKRGWGHSSWRDAVSYAQVTGASQLVLFHHDPSHTDEVLEEIEAQARSAWVGERPPVLARQGSTIELTAKAAAFS